MVIFRSFGQYRRAMQKRIRRLDKARDKTSLDAAAAMVARAKAYAPRKTGETMQGIRKRKMKKGQYQVESRVRPKGDSGFRQNMWANHTPPHDRPRMRWNNGKPTFYGKGHKTSSRFPNTGFFNRAALETRNVFRKGALNNTRKALRATF